ncbi:hypothetical protein D3C77_467220 [compost metagenome]
MITSGFSKLITFERPNPRISPVSCITSIARESPRSYASETIWAVIADRSSLTHFAIILERPLSSLSVSVLTIPIADTYLPRQPELPQRQGRPSRYIFIWPISPALDVVPYITFPSFTIPEPRPVPNVSNTKFL